MICNEYIISFEYIESLIGESLSKRIREDLIGIMQNKNIYDKKSMSKYNYYLNDYLSYFKFDILTSNNFIFTEKCDLILEKSQIIRNLELTKNEVIAFIRSGIVVLPKRLYIYCKSLNSDDYTETEL